MRVPTATHSGIGRDWKSSLRTNRTSAASGCTRPMSPKSAANMRKVSFWDYESSKREVASDLEPDAVDDE